MDDSLQDIFLGQHTFHIFYKLVGFVDLIILEVVDYEVETGFRDHIQQWG